MNANKLYWVKSEFLYCYCRDRDVSKKSSAFHFHKFLNLSSLCSAWQRPDLALYFVLKELDNNFQGMYSMTLEGSIPTQQATSFIEKIFQGNTE